MFDSSVRPQGELFITFLAPASISGFHFRFRFPFLYLAFILLLLLVICFRSWGVGLTSRLGLFDHICSTFAAMRKKTIDPIAALAQIPGVPTREIVDERAFRM